jgi:hypothetical protein
MDNIQKDQQVNILETFDGWTIDRRLKQLRKIDKDDKILFVDFDSELGQAIFEKKILVAEQKYLEKSKENRIDNRWEYDYNMILNEIMVVENVINKLESEL